MKCTKYELIYLLSRKSPTSFTKLNKLKIDEIEYKFRKEDIGLINDVRKKVAEYTGDLAHDTVFYKIPKALPKSLRLILVIDRNLSIKQDLIFLAFHRNFDIEHNLHTLPIPKLKLLLRRDKHVEMITDEEVKLLESQRQNRKLYGGNIEHNCMYYCIPKSYHIDNQLDILLQNDVQVPVTLDEYQSCVVNISKSTYCIAGPGGGKTQTLVKTVKKFHVRGKSVLCLMFNIAVRNEFKKKLKREGIKVSPKDQIHNGRKGVFVLSFHEYAHRRIHGTSVSSDNSTETPDMIFSYDTLIEEASKIGCLEKWDYVLIDEAQDITPDQQKLIESINTNIYLYMGDARQQLFARSYVYSKLLKEQKYQTMELYNNYRCGGKILEFINKYSSVNFPRHIDLQQDVANTNSSCVDIVISTNVSNDIVDRLMEYKQGETFIISPLSVKRFKNQTVTGEVRQEAYKRGRNLLVSEYSKINECDDYICNSFSIKGLERKQVILYGVSNTQIYSDYVSDDQTLKCLLYVALSRAIERLVIIVDKKKYFKPNLLDFALEDYHLASKLYTPPSQKEIEFPTSVTDHLCMQPIPIKTVDNSNISKLEIQRKYIEDAAGIFVEASIAKQLKILKTKYDVYGYDQICRYRSDAYTIKFLKLHSKSGDFIKAEKAIKDLEMSGDNSNFIYTKIKFIQLIGLDWTVSDSLLQEKINVEEYAKIIGNSIHQKSIEYRVPISRSKKHGMIVYGEADFVTDENVYEIKHAFDKEEHHRQAAIYGKLLNKKPFVINTLTGEYREVSLTCSDEVFNQYLRSIQLLKIAHVFRSGLEMLNLSNDTLAFVDVEHDFFVSSRVREISIIIIEISTCTVKDIYYEMICAEPFDETRYQKIDPQFTPLTGLVPTSGKYYHDKTKLNSFLDKYADLTFVQWCGSDTNLLRKELKSLDLSKSYKIYRKFLNDNGMSVKTGYKLNDAIEKLVPYDFEWEPHRAFEDTIVMAMVYYIMARPR